MTAWRIVGRGTKLRGFTKCGVIGYFTTIWFVGRSLKEHSASSSEKVKPPHNERKDWGRNINVAVFMFQLHMDEAKLTSAVRPTFEGGVVEDCGSIVEFWGILRRVCRLQ
jgi:hypothetical protein